MAQGYQENGYSSDVENYGDYGHILDMSDRTMTSTPKRDHALTTDTPKSILKHRKIIDDNVRVESEYQHTPYVSPKSKGLNFSYSNVDDITLAKMVNREVSRRASQSDTGMSSGGEDLDGSYLEEASNRSGSSAGSKSHQKQVQHKMEA